MARFDAAKRKKPGPKPKNTGVRDAVKAHLEQQEIEKAHERGAQRCPAVIAYQAKAKGKKRTGKSGSMEIVRRRHSNIYANLRTNIVLVYNWEYVGSTAPQL